MSELVLVKSHVQFTSIDKTTSYYGDRIVGLSVPGLRTVMEYEHRLDGDETEESLELGDSEAGKLAEFYNRCYVAPTWARPFYNCHLLAWFISGKAPRLYRYDQYDVSGQAPAPTNGLEPGNTYAIKTADGNLSHSIIGIERPDHNLSVLGDRSPLAITANEVLMSVYDGVAIEETIPETAYACS